MISRRTMIGGALAALSLPLPVAAAPIEKIKANGVLRVAVYRDFEPWSWSRGGKFVGADVDLANAIAKQIGVRAEIVDFLADEGVDDDLRNMVWRGSLVGGIPCDVMMHVPVDREFALRNDRAVIGAPYYRETFEMACNIETDCEVPPPQFKGKHIVAELDSIPDFYLSGGFGGMLRPDVRHLPSGQAAIDALKTGEADVAMASRAQVEHALMNGSATVKTRKGPIPGLTSPGWDIGLAVKDDSRDLADLLDAMIGKFRTDGTIESVLKPYGVSPRAPLSA